MVRKQGKGSAGLVLVLLTVLALMAGVGAEKVPAPWFDEGWTLVVARNWVEQGIYAIDLVDEWVSAAPMTHPFSVTVPVAASFRLLGVGVLSGRLPGILFTVGSLALLFGLAREMYGSKTAWVTMAVLILLAPQVSINPLLFGRQVLGEPPMLFYLLLGYWFFLRALRGSLQGIVLASLLWGLALISKRQILPFWLAAILLMLAVVALRREWQIVRSLIAVGLGTGVAAGAFLAVETWLVGDWPSNGTFPMEDLYLTAAWTWVPEVRLGILLKILRFGIFLLFGVIVCTRNLVRHFRQPAAIPAPAWCELSLIVLTGTWFIWYAFGSLGWPRYYYPIFVLSAVFFARFLIDWTDGFHRWPTPGLLQDSRLKFWKALIALSLIALNLGFVVKSFEYIPAEAKLDVDQVSEYFHNQVATDALVETYDSELHFLLPQPIHYPPDRLQIDLNRRTFLGQSVPITYNPLVYNPAYLVIGPRGEEWQLYQPWVESGDLQVVQEYPGYRIYRRVP